MLSCLSGAFFFVSLFFFFAQVVKNLVEERTGKDLNNLMSIRYLSSCIYSSEVHKTQASSYSWQFIAERWEAFLEKYTEPMVSLFPVL